MAAVTHAELTAIRASQELQSAEGTTAEKCQILRQRLMNFPLADQEHAYAVGQAILCAPAPLREACLSVAPWPTPANYPAMVRAGVVAAERTMPRGSGSLKKQQVLSTLADIVDAAVATEECPLTAEEGAALKASTEGSIELMVSLFSGRDDGANAFVAPVRIIFGCLHLCRARRVAARQ